MSALGRRIAVFTGTRADYGLLRPLIGELEEDPRAQLQLIVSGSHLSQTHGATVEEIVADGHPIAARIAIWSDSDAPVAAAADFGAAVGSFAEALGELSPDVVVVLGDRLEALAMATAATIVAVPVAHIHGGELTEGAMDDALRHAITKLSYLHFVTAEEHRQRVIQLGEEPSRVYSFGAPVLDAIAELQLFDADEIEERFRVRIDRGTVLVTFHPALFDTLPSLDLLAELLAALDGLEVEVVITGTNSDIGSAELRAAITEYVHEHPDTARFVESFGQLGYLSAMRLAGAVAGNSSSVVLEAPLLGVPSVLVGDRQHGRPLSPSVLTPEPVATEIAAAVELALSDGFRESASARGTVFGSAGFAKRAAEVLLETEIPRPPRKRFYDIPGHDGLADSN